MTHLWAEGSSLTVALAGVLEEAEFYNIASLVRLVKERIRDNENRTSQVHSRLGLLFMLLLLLYDQYTIHYKVDNLDIQNYLISILFALLLYGNMSMMIAFQDLF